MSIGFRKVRHLGYRASLKPSVAIMRARLYSQGDLLSGSVYIGLKQKRRTLQSCKNYTACSVHILLLVISAAYILLY